MLTALAIINMAVAAILITDTDIEAANLSTSSTEPTEIIASASIQNEAKNAE